MPETDHFSRTITVEIMNCHGTRSHGMRPAAADTPESGTVHLERAEETRFKTANRWSRRAAVITAIHKKIASAIAIQISDPNVATKSMTVLSCQEWSGDGDLPVELSGILGVADMQRLLSTTKTDRQKKKRKQ